MKQITKTKYIPLLLIIASLIVSCSKLSDNGKLDGKWQLIEMYSKTDPASTAYTEFQPKYDQGIYWIFQLRLLNIVTKSLSNEVVGSDIIARFNHYGNQLQVTETYVHFRERDSLITDTNTALMEPIGIRGNATNYNVRDLSSTRMILCSEYDSLVFKKK